MTRMRPWRLAAALLLSLAAACGVAWAQQGPVPGRMTGTMFTTDRKPLARGQVYFFRVDGIEPAPEKYWRVPDLVADIGDDGRFAAELPEGDYYLGAIKRVKSSASSGPPQVGDLYYKALDKKGRPLRFSIRQGGTLDIGEVAKASPFQGLAGKGAVSAVRGTVLFNDGSPAGGVFVFAFLSGQMQGRPAFASYSTGSNGRYVLRVQGGGTYYLRARDSYAGGPPEKGAIIGTLGGDEPQPVVVRQGKTVRGVDIIVQRFVGRGPESREEQAQ